MLRPFRLVFCAVLASIALLAAGCVATSEGDDDSAGTSLATSTSTAEVDGNTAADATAADDDGASNDEQSSGSPTPGEQGDAETAESSPEPAPVESDPIEPTCGGDMPANITPGESNPLVLESGGQERTLLLYVPSGYDPSVPMPLVLNFHGAGGQALQQEQASGFVPVAEQEGFLLATPDGRGDSPRWEFSLEAPDNSVQFAEDLTDRLAADFCIEPARIYSAGFSNGAFLSSALACAMPDRISAIATVGGVYFPGEECTTAVPTLAFHGTDDATVPFDGGTVEALGDLEYDGVRKSLQDWAELGDCNPIPYPSQIAEGASREGYDSCEGGGALDLVVLEGFGHDWPTTESAGVSAAELSWEFFQRFGP